jgi:uncharacterized RDD family membrane protein YckC
MQPATIGKRIGAFVIDAIGFAVVVWMFGHLMLAIRHGADDLTVILAVFVLPPITALACWLIGNTPGKKAMGLYIVDARTGGRPSFWQFVSRAILFSLLISFNIVFVIPVLVTKKHRAFHDMLARTLVVEG